MNLCEVDINDLGFNILPHEDKIFPGENAVILWDHTIFHNVFDVAVINSPLGSRNHMAPRFAKLPASDGRICSGWMEGREYNTPERIYGGMLSNGFANADEHLKALAGFARIKEANWARRMLIGMPNVRFHLEAVREAEANS